MKKRGLYLCEIEYKNNRTKMMCYDNKGLMIAVLKEHYHFDFYIPSINYVIEVHGQQHYYQSPMFDQALEERQKIDLYKKDYCEQHGVGYLEIPYWLIIQSKTETYKTMINNILKKD